MIVFHAPEEVPADFGPAVVVIGKFDGVHTGHRALIERAQRDAAAMGPGIRTVVVTFDRHPLSLLAPGKCPVAIVGPEQKLRLLEATGVDATLVLRFDAERAAQPAREFVEDVLVRHLHARTVMVGGDFRFGRGGAGDVALLRELGAELGFAVDELREVRTPGAERRVSSTWVREALEAGDVATAATLLGREPAVRGEVVHGLKRGREMGSPTANLSPDAEGLVPADGVYAGWLVDLGVDAEAGGAGDAARTYPAAISVGDNPTFFDVPVRQVEAHVIDAGPLDLYGHTVEVRFASRIRGMVAYEGIEPLIAQMTDDVARARESLRG
ncbi:MAG: bifunctional riboflavin kinase/FAD synthetase [Microbacteriaceae bacterium]